MAGASGGGVVRLSLDELIALNEEIAALVRAGVPLERGLAGIGRDLRGRLGRVARAVGGRMEAEGCSIDEALATEAKGLPALYGAVVAAGARAGRLPAALEGLTTFARGVGDLRRTIGLAMLYPMMVLAIAYVLFVGFAAVLAPRLVEGFRSLDAPSNGVAEGLARLGESAAAWGPAGLALIGLGAICWVRSGRASVLGPGGAGGVIGRVPGMRGLVDLSRGALLAELLALLIENRVPLPDALELAGRAAGGPGPRSAADRAAEATRLGEDLREALPIEAARALPPMLRWLILNGSARRDLPGALRIAARTYRDRAAARAEVVRMLVPTLLLVGVGGLAVLLYGLALFVPFTRLLGGLG